MTINKSKYMSNNELSILRSTTSSIDSKSWLLVDVATQTGLRVSEISRLTFGDIDFRASMIRVSRSKKRDKKAQDFIPISDSLLSHLKAYFTSKSVSDMSRHLFVGQRGNMTVYGLQKLWKKACSVSGLDKSLSIHSARHTMAVMMLRETKNLRMVQKQLGHSSPVTTANQYADVPFEEQQQALNRMFT